MELKKLNSQLIEKVKSDVIYDNKSVSLKINEITDLIDYKTMTITIKNGRIWFKNDYAGNIKGCFVSFLTHRFNRDIVIDINLSYKFAIHAGYYESVTFDIKKAKAGFRIII